MTTSQTYDAIVIGAGINGAATALELARRGLKVALVERRQVGEGPSGRSSAIVRTHYSNPLTARMALFGLRVFQEFESYVGGDCGFRNAGFVVLADARDQEGLQANMAMQRSVGIRTELLPPQDLTAMVPGLLTEDLVAAAYEPESGYADPYLTVQAYARAVRRQGVQLFQNTTVTAIRIASGNATGVTTSAGDLHAPMIVNAAGPWARPLARTAGIELPINPCRVQVAFFRRPAGHERPHPVVGDFINATYFRPETGNLTLVGLIDPSEAAAIVDPDGFDEHVDRDFLVDAGTRLVRRYPAMDAAESTGGYAALYDITPDWHPIVDELPAGSGLFHCAGFSGHGFKLGPAVGVMMAELVTQAPDPQFPAQLFRLSRFDEEDPVRGQYDYSIVG